MSKISTHHRTCNLCEAMCGLEIQHQNGEILSIKGDKNDPLSRGHICPKAVALQDIYKDPNRLKTPIKRTENGWESISWEQAYEEVYLNLKSIQGAHGNNAVGVYQGNPNVHNMGSMMFGPTFVRALNTKNRFSATSADQLPHQVASLLMLGHVLLTPIPDIDRTDFMLIIGANPLVSNGSMMTCPDFAKRLKAIQKRGGKFIVIDPRRTETAEKADEHIFIKPGRDALLLLGLIHTIFAEKLVDLRHLKDVIDGLEIIENAVKNYSPEKVEKPLGIANEKIRELAREMATANSAVCYARMGASTQIFGGICQWLSNVLNILTGNFDREGGAMFTLPAFDHVGMTTMQGKGGSFGRRRSRVRNLPEYSGEFPVATMAEEILTEGEGQIKAMVTIAGNPLLSVPNGQQLEKAFSGLEYMVAVDIYLNETTRHANIILPPTTGVETSHYDLIFNVLAIRNTAKYSPALFEKEENQRYDWQIFKGLATKFTGKADDGSTPEMLLDYALKNGPYKKQDIDLKALKENPSGIDLGALKPILKHRLNTKDKRIQLAPAIYVNDLERLEKTFFDEKENAENEFPFDLIGRRQLRGNNSWMHNAARLMRGRNRCTLLLNPKDAISLSFKNGQIVSVESRVGRIQIEAELSDEIMPGVVSIPHGFGHGKKGIQMDVAAANAGVNINDLTDELLIDEVTGNVAFSGVGVLIKRVE
ncbi:MAG: anaerobic selenocysteine-containing dehydrogenase [Paraglaciecola sp.]|jgi:anaerobic selenocysteine-containing dehydrogenase